MKPINIRQINFSLMRWIVIGWSEFIMKSGCQSQIALGFELDWQSEKYTEQQTADRFNEDYILSKLIYKKVFGFVFFL